MTCSFFVNILYGMGGGGGDAVETEGEMLQLNSVMNARCYTCIVIF